MCIRDSSKDHPSPCIVNMPFLAVNNMVANKESKLDGIAVSHTHLCLINAVLAVVALVMAKKNN